MGLIMIHHNFDKGKKILVITKDGQKHIGKYVDTKSNYLILDNEEIKFEDIRSSTIYKERK